MDFYTISFKVQNGRGLGSRDLISKFWDPLITFERIEQSASNLVQRWRTEPSNVWNIKRPLSWRGLGHVIQFRNFGTPYNV